MCAGYAVRGDQDSGRLGWALRGRMAAMNWPAFAMLSAMFAALTAIFGKIGVRDIDSNLAVAIRTTVVVVFAWGLVMLHPVRVELGAKDVRVDRTGNLRREGLSAQEARLVAVAKGDLEQDRGVAREHRPGQRGRVGCSTTARCNWGRPAG